MTLAYTIYFTMLAVLLIVAYWTRIWGPRGLFWYRKEEDLGHMLAFLGYQYSLIIFGKYFSWRRS